MIDVKNYLDLGYTDIVFLECEQWECKSGYNEDYTRQTFLCYDDKKIAHKITILWTEHPFKPPRCVIESDEEVHWMEYNKIRARKGGIADNEAYHKRRVQIEKERTKAERALAQLVPKCPDCQSPMTPRQNHQTRDWFWGCPNFPDCRKTRSMRQETFDRYVELSKQAHRR